MSLVFGCSSEPGTFVVAEPPTEHDADVVQPTVSDAPVDESPIRDPLPLDGSDARAADPQAVPDTRSDSAQPTDRRDALDETAEQDTSPVDATTLCTESTTPNPNVGLSEIVLSGGCPAGMVAIGGTFCIDAFEAFLEGWSPYARPVAPVPSARSVEGAVPQAYITGRQSEAACLAANKRLCTLLEWERACGGATGYTYPYGDTRQEGWCNDARARHPAIEWFGTSADWIWSQLDHPCINQQADSLSTAGAHPDCATPENAYDLMGNLHEWVADTAGVMRGGFYADTRVNGNGCDYQTTAHGYDYADYSTGFRCCADLD